MKTTIEISDAILRETRRLAAREGTTLREMVERGLSMVLSQEKGGKTFELRKASFRGKGLQPAARSESWEWVREKIYEGRGG